jgi:hypothetical protein
MMVPSVNFLGLCMFALERVCMEWLLVGSGAAGTLELATAGDATCWLVEQGTACGSGGVGKVGGEWDTGGGEYVTCGREVSRGEGKACGVCRGVELSGIDDEESGRRDGSGIELCLWKSIDLAEV